jgi:hypothetical protein
MQQRNRLGELWIAAVDLSPGRDTLPRVYVGTAFKGLSPAGVDYFGSVATSVHGIVGVSDASGNEMLSNGTGFILALQLNVDDHAMDGEARRIANQFFDRLKVRLDGISDPDYVLALTQSENIHNLAEALAYHSSDLERGIHHFDE